MTVAAYENWESLQVLSETTTGDQTYPQTRQNHMSAATSRCTSNHFGLTYSCAHIWFLGSQAAHLTHDNGLRRLQRFRNLKVTNSSEFVQVFNYWSNSYAYSYSEVAFTDNGQIHNARNNSHRCPFDVKIGQMSEVLKAQGAQLILPVALLHAAAFALCCLVSELSTGKWPVLVPSP
ncbi:hypothetical protein V6N13_095240 [Hibiscus sabdariffa]